MNESIDRVKRQVMKQYVELICYRPNGEICLEAKYQNMTKALATKKLILEDHPNYRVVLNDQPEDRLDDGEAQK